MDIKEEIKSLKAHIALLEKQLADEKKQEEPVFERVIGENYYIVDSCRLSGVDISKEYDSNNRYDKSMYENNNYFRSRERAEEVAEKIDMLLKLERLHDTFCPDYVPNWDCRDEEKYYVYYDNDVEFYKYNFARICKQNEVYFSTYEIAHNVCDILNAEKGNEND